MTAKKQIEELLLRNGKVDNFYCIDNRITTRLGAVIHKLNQQGWKIEGEDMKDGTKNYVYKLIKSPQQYTPQSKPQNLSTLFTAPIKRAVNIDYFRG